MAGIPQVITEDRASGAQFIGGSLKFDSNKGQYLKRTPTANGNRRLWTWSGWLKQSPTGSEQDMFSAGQEVTNDGYYTRFRLQSDSLNLRQWNASLSLDASLISSRKLRDPSAFFHCVMIYDVDNSTNTDKVRWYINGQRVTSFSATVYPGSESWVNNISKTHTIGGHYDGGSSADSFWNGHMSQVYFLDGIAAGPEEFGYTDPLTGTWRPKKYEGDFKIIPDNQLLYNVNTGDNGFDSGTSSRTYDATGRTFATYTTPQTANPGGYGANSAHVYKSPDGAAIDWVISTDTTDRYIWTSTDGVNWTNTGVQDTDGSPQTVNTAWLAMAGGSNASNITVTSSTAGYGLVVGRNSFYLPMDGNSPIGEDKSGIVTPNNGSIWSASFSSSSGFRSSEPKTNAFDGNTSSICSAVGSGTITFTSPVTFASNSTIRVFLHGGDHTVTVNGGSDQTISAGSFQPVTYSNSGNATFTMTFHRGGGSDTGVRAIEIDGVLLVDGQIGNNWTPVGFGGSVELSKATGAIPILSTNEAGTAAKPGVRTDSKTYTVTASGGNYYIDGVLKPTLNAYRGGSYTFDYTGATSHPLYLSSLPDGKHNSKAYSVQFDGTNDYLSVPDSDDFDLAGNDWTIEAFVYHSSTNYASYEGILAQWVLGSGTARTWTLETVGSGATSDLEFYYVDSSNNQVGPVQGGTLTKNKWHHVAACRSGNTIRMFVDGVMYGSGTTINVDIKNSTDPLWVGRVVDGYWNGEISNARVINGTALYTTNFTPPSTTLTNVTNTKLLCCQDSDATTGAVLPSGSAITVNGSAAATNSRNPFLYNISGSYGVNTGTSNTTKITIPHWAADTLYYYCNAHSGMGSSINVTTDSRKADPYAWKNVLAMPLIGSSVDYSGDINVGTTSKSVTNSNGPNYVTTSSNFYGGSGDFSGTSTQKRIDITTSGGNFGFGLGDFTIEWWMYATRNSTTNGYVWDTTGQKSSLIRKTNGGMTFETTGSSGSIGEVTILSGGSYGLNKWVHWAVVRSGDSVRVYLDGVLTQTTSGFSGVNFGDVNGFISGYNSGGANYNADAFLQDFRIYKGVAKYTENFAVGSTDPDVRPDTPSSITGKTNLTKVTEGAVSGFEGNSDYLNIIGSTDFVFDGDHTIELFVYHNSLSDDSVPWCTGGSGQPDQIYIGTNGICNYGYGQTGVVSAPAGTIVVGRWQHIAVSKQGTNLRLFVDGKIVASSTNHSSSIGRSSNDARIGNRIDGGNAVRGFISNLRVVKGTALYTSEFTPPTEPLTAVTNTKLLCCQSNTSATAAAVLPDGQITVNNNSGTAGAYAPTGLTGGIVFPSGQGNTDNSNGMYLSSPSTSFAGNYTIEFWFNVDTLPSEGSGAYGSVFFDGRPTSGGNADNVFGSIYGYNTTGSSNDFTMRYHANAADRITGTTNLSVGTWYHYALVRNNGTVTQYINGTADGSYSHSAAMISYADRPYIGGWGFGSGGVPGHNNYAVDGKMSNLRMTSTAVYTANFTPPTSNLTAIPGTTFLGLQSTSSATAYTFVSGYLHVAGNATATTFNPFTDDINAIRGQASGYATLNPLNVTGTLSDNNLSFYRAAKGGTTSTIGVESGKIYVEAKGDVGSGGFGFGFVQSNYNNNGSTDIGDATNSFGIRATNSNITFKIQGATNTSISRTSTLNTIFAFAVDFDTGLVNLLRDGVIIHSQTLSLASGTYYVAVASETGSATKNVHVNFGQKPFKFPPPDGFQPLNLSNVQPEKVIARPDKYVDVSLWTGNGTSQDITGLKHKPDLVWIKSRSFSNNHHLFDSVRGPNKILRSSTTDQESTTNVMTSFNNDGFTVAEAGGNNATNDDTSTFVGWTWKAGGNKNTFNIDDVGYANASDVNMSVGSLNSSVYDQSQRWRNYITSSIGFHPSYPAAKAFNGVFDGDGGLATNGADGVVTFTPPAMTVTSLEVNVYSNSTITLPDGTTRSVAGSSTVNNMRTVNIGSGFSFTGSNSIVFTPPSGSHTYIERIKINGKELVDDDVTVTNAPSIANTGCSVGTKQGFSIIKYSHTVNSYQTIAHGLTQTPQFIIAKYLDGTTNWNVYHASASGAGGGAETGRFTLNNANTYTNEADVWGDTPPTDKVWTVGGSTWQGSGNHISYLWHDVPGLQKFGKYTANNSADGPYIELGFRPALVVCKSVTQGQAWQVYDEARSSTNPTNRGLKWDSGDTEYNSTDRIDILSNGFKIRAGGGTEPNVGSNTYVYCAWAEAPSINLYGAQSNAR